MSIENVLTKLAENAILKGNYSLAFNLVAASKEASCDHCGERTKCALKGCPVIKDYCDMVKSGEKAYCCKNCAKKDKENKLASVVARDDSGKIRKDQERRQMRKDKDEEKWNFDQGGETNDTPPTEDKEVSALTQLIQKYADISLSTEPTTALSKMIQKYAQFGVPDSDNDQDDDLPLHKHVDINADKTLFGDDEDTDFPPEYWEAQGKGYDAGSVGDDHNPYPPGSPMAMAFSGGVEYGMKHPKHQVTTMDDPLGDGKFGLGSP